MNIFAKHDAEMKVEGGKWTEQENLRNDNANMKKDLGENIKVLMTLEEEQREETKATERGSGKYKKNNKNNNNRGGGATLSSSQIRAFIGLCNHVSTFILLLFRAIASYHPNTMQVSFVEYQVQIWEWYLSSFMSENWVVERGIDK